jgi:hypothetical protein
MGIFRLQHMGVGVAHLGDACRTFEHLFGLPCRDLRDDQGKGKQYDSRILLGNECWLHLVQNWHLDSRVYRFSARNGQALEHITLQTTTIEDDVAYLRSIGIPVYKDKVFDAADGYEAFVYPHNGVGFTVELIQPHATSWDYPES